jgi:hypothetical protein
MNFIDHSQNVMRKEERIDTLEALLATHEAMGAEPDSQNVKELKERIKAARMQLMAMKGAPISPRMRLKFEKFDWMKTLAELIRTVIGAARQSSL